MSNFRNNYVLPHCFNRICNRASSYFHKIPKRNIWKLNTMSYMGGIYPFRLNTFPSLRKRSQTWRGKRNSAISSFSEPGLVCPCISEALEFANTSVRLATPNPMPDDIIYDIFSSWMGSYWSNFLSLRDIWLI